MVALGPPSHLILGGQGRSTAQVLWDSRGPALCSLSPSLLAPFTLIILILSWTLSSMSSEPSSLDDFDLPSRLKYQRQTTGTHRSGCITSFI
jgi:hypothetical protein